LKKSPRRGRIEASLLVAESNHPTGNGKTLARKIRALYLYYRTYGSLPLETRGGKQKNRSYLNNEDVFKACRAWLLAQKLATVTPKGFRHALNTQIMPRLLASAKKSKKSLLGKTTGTRNNPGKKQKEWKSLSRTATYKWLNRLGFYATKEKKGVYVDGYKREDVIEYRQKEFLPQMALYQSLTTNYEEDANKVLQPILPTLPPGEKEHVIYYHDESCFHAKDYSTRIWLDENQQKMPSKSKGGLIHCSDFISLEGRLTIGQKDARKIIYPGGPQKNAYWDTEALLEQIDEAIDIFEEKHPNKVAVFVFDQSSAHASKGSRALNAFAMNLGEGGAPLPQKVNFSYTFPFRKYLLTGYFYRIPTFLLILARLSKLVG
jgi:hypothetical protein